jgi:hypothetical protein
MRGHAPVRRQLGLITVKLIQSEHRIRIAHINGKQHRFST